MHDVGPKVNTASTNVLLADLVSPSLQLGAGSKRISLVNAFEAGARGSVVVKALCYKPEGRGFDSR
jgi:hypothetical protein